MHPLGFQLCHSNRVGDRSQFAELDKASTPTRDGQTDAGGCTDNPIVSPAMA